MSVKHCDSCQVEWQTGDDGPDCWACGQPGVQGFVRSFTWSNAMHREPAASGDRRVSPLDVGAA